ncbi:MAG: ABC transporter ATP-binding protein [Candidatus Odinarchaeota archaeon]
MSDKKDQDKRDQLHRKYSDREMFRRLIRYIVQYRMALTVALITMFLGSLLEIIQPVLLLIAIDYYIIPGNMSGLIGVAILYFLVSTASFLFSMTSTYLTTVTGLKIVTLIRQEAFNHLQDLSMDYYAKESTGRIVSRITNDVERLADLLSFGLIDAVVNSIFLVMLFSILFYLDLQLAIIVLLLTPFLALFILFFRIKTRKAWQHTRKTLAKVTGYYQEAISGIEVSKAFVVEDFLAEEFDELNLENYRARLRALTLFAIMFPVLDVIFAMASAIVLTVGGYAVGVQLVTLGVLVAFLSYLTRLSQPILILSNFYNSFLSAMAASERIFDIMDREPGVIPRNSNKLDRVSGSVEFRDITFTYDKETVLSDFNLTIPPRTTIALVGHTGAGKTTLTNLICRFYDFNKGEILLDGMDIRDIDLKNYRQWVAIIPQDSFLFSGTIRKNLLYGNPDATEEEMEKALLRAGAFDFVMNIGLDSEVGERGSRLSIGERQLLCFARALLAEPKILILDEATSSVDAHTELIIQQSLQHILGSCTAIIIAHRLSTVRAADRIIVLDHGKIAEEGTFDELLMKSGIFANLYEKQFSKQQLNGSKDS